MITAREVSQPDPTRGPMMLVNLSKARAAKGLAAAKPLGAKNAPAELWCVIGADGQPEHFSSWPDACHDHIGDAINSGDPDAGQCVVRRYVLSPPTKEQA